MVAETNVEPFLVYGTNSAYGLIAEAQVYVRPELSEGGIAIQGAESFERTVAVGEQPKLPTHVLVSYNDGSKDNQAVGVEWDYDETLVEEAGVYTLQGALQLPWYVSSAGTVATTLKLTVLGDAVTSVTLDPASVTLEPGDTQQFTATVEAIGDADKALTWAVTGADSEATTISDSGLLSVGADETATTLTVTATSSATPTVWGSASVAVEHPAEPVVLESIAVTQAPTKTSYKVGEDLNLTGLMVEASFSDGSKAPVAVAELKVDGYDRSIAGSQVITVGWTSGEVTKNATFTVEVKAARVPPRLRPHGEADTDPDAHGEADSDPDAHGEAHPGQVDVYSTRVCTRSTAAAGTPPASRTRRTSAAARASGRAPFSAGATATRRSPAGRSTT
ncbi:Ig-like domain-containing protein [Tessaracoccus coleopterorum]|uniref:Ig-like domain-containing protein n=1 Tax=Tessaracoccus coleopterorum TaxID=2714950 RepID=UPI001E2D31FD|nr:Ig-like domain-containing protein [Tessaracoccus coleopterorum]